MTWALTVGKTRRIFALSAGVTALVLGAVAACSAGSPSPAAEGDDTSTAGSGGSGVAGDGAGGTGTAGAGVAGASGGSAGAGTAGAGPVTLTITPPAAACGGPYAMDFGAAHVEVDPTQGGRISAMKLSGTDLLFLKSQAAAAGANYTNNWGATFWPSPQSTWNWPPLAPIDSNPYTCPASDTQSFTLQSAPNTAKVTMSVAKKFSVDVNKNALVIDYTMTNTGTAAIMVAPWEISRVANNALIFYPAASPPAMKGSMTLPPTTTDASGVTWYQVAPANGERKLYADGSGGWLATVLGSNIFVKKFDDVPASAQPATEAEIEVYSNAYYTEVENQGAYASLAAGANVTWTVRWFVRPLPAGMTATLGDPNLVAFAQSIVQ